MRLIAIVLGEEVSKVRNSETMAKLFSEEQNKKDEENNVDSEN